MINRATVDVSPEFLAEFMALKSGAIRIVGSVNSDLCVRLAIEGDEIKPGQYTAICSDIGLTRTMTLTRVEK